MVWKDSNEGLVGTGGIDADVDNSSSDDSDSDSDLSRESAEDTRRGRRDSSVLALATDLQTCNFHKFMHRLTGMISFWILVTIMIVAEPMIVSWNPYEDNWAFAVAGVIIAISSVLLVVQVGGKTYEMDEEWLAKQSQGRSRKDKEEKMAIPENITIRVKHVLFSGSFILEFACLLCGWVFLYYRPGIATLRCFRAFRILWYHELPSDVLEPLKRFMAMVLGTDLVELMFRVMKFATRSLSHLGQEMLFLTKKSRGGFILMFMLFYIAYVLGATLWIETANSDLGDFCASLGSCTYTMIRLTFFDGNGFDFAYSLADGHPILFGITCLYLCVTSFGIVNGLIGVFGDIFKDDSDIVFETNKEEERKAQQKENEHFQRYNNTAESLILVQMQLQNLDKRFEKLESLIQGMAKK